MSSLPLVVEKHFFTKVLVEANPNYLSGKDEDQPVGFIHTEVHGGARKDDLRRWRLFLTVRTETSEEEKIPYKIDLECVGFFTVSAEVEEKKIPFLVYANGAAILYSSTREFLLMITGRGPRGGFYLPTTNFLEPPTKTEVEKETLPTTPAPKAIKKKRSPKSKSVSQ